MIITQRTKQRSLLYRVETAITRWAADITHTFLIWRKMKHVPTNFIKESAIARHLAANSDMNVSVRITSWIVFGITVLIFGTFLTAGIGWYWSAESSTSSVTSSPPAISPPLYKNILLLQVDSTQKDKSTIQSVWLLRLPVNRAARFEVFAFHPSTFSGRGGISQDLLQDYVIGTITNTLVFDRNNLSSYIDRLGGITVASQPMDGAGVWRYLDSADANYSADLAIKQAAVAHSILVKMAMVSGRIDLDTLFGDSLAQSNYAELLALLHYYYPMRTDSFQVQLVNPS